jgi:[pyruvate, phosphate dikinase]-phosphate phosphotransferase / [pyruvate, phosphate dikinase] kinase
MAAGRTPLATHGFLLADQTHAAARQKLKGASVAREIAGKTTREPRLHSPPSGPTRGRLVPPPQSCRLAAPLLVPPLRSRLSSMIQEHGSAAPLLPPSSPLALATGSPPAHEDTGSAPRSPSSPTMRASSQLNRWSRARALRSGHRISPSAPVAKPAPLAEEGRVPAAPAEGGEEEDGGVCPAERDAALGKAIYMVSDGTGWTAEHSVSAALGQFEHCLADRRCVVSTHLFSGVSISRRPLCRFVWSSWKEVHVVLAADPDIVSGFDGYCSVFSSKQRIKGPASEKRRNC